MKREDQLASAPLLHGVGMDRMVKGSKRRNLLIFLGIAGLVSIFVLIIWLLVPHAMAVPIESLSIYEIKSGTFRDDLVVRSKVAPWASIVLDASENGRVEEVIVRDGALVKKGQLIFRLSNAQREQDVLAREADLAQQLANLSTQRAALAANQSAARRDIADLTFQVNQTEKNLERDKRLATQGFISTSNIESTADRLQQQRQLLSQGKSDYEAELSIREQSVKQLESAITRLTTGFDLLRLSADGLRVRAPQDGILTGFTLQQGQSVRVGDHLGRLDTADKFKLEAKIDEFYLGRVSRGIRGEVEVQGQIFTVSVEHINTEVKEGRFTVELQFISATPAGLQPGQGLDLRMTLGHAVQQAILLGDGPFYAESGGAWAYVLDAEGKYAERRSISLGRRAAGQIEVLGGLRPGDRVVVSSYKRFDEAQRIQLNH